MGLAYIKESGGFLITSDDQPIGRLRYTANGCVITGIPWFHPRTYPTAWAARLALADTLVEEQMLEEHGDCTRPRGL
jgi:hypothetical protein